MTPAAQKTSSSSKPEASHGPAAAISVAAAASVQTLPDLSPQALVEHHYRVGSALVIGETPAPVPQGLERSGPQGAIRPLTLIEDPSVWYAADYRGREAKWAVPLTQQDLAELDSAIASVEALGLAIQDVTQADFPLPTLGPKLVAVRVEVQSGRGFALITGLPVARLTRSQTVLAYWGFGLYWGRANSQNARGHLVGHVKNIGHDPRNPITRIYATRLPQPYHNDSSDIAALLCLMPAKTGGGSSWCSSMALHNELLKRAPHLVPVLAGDWWLDRKGEIPDGKQPFFRLPILHYHEGFAGVNYDDTYVHLAQRHADVPRLTPAQVDAMAWVNALARSELLRLDYELQPGDIQLVSNHTVLHTRAGWEDSPEEDRKRHLLRLWIAPPHDRPLPDAYAEIWGSTEPGARGGIVVRGQMPSLPLEAE